MFRPFLCSLFLSFTVLFPVSLSQEVPHDAESKRVAEEIFRENFESSLTSWTTYSGEGDTPGTSGWRFVTGDAFQGNGYYRIRGYESDPAICVAKKKALQSPLIDTTGFTGVSISYAQREPQPGDDVGKRKTVEVYLVSPEEARAFAETGYLEEHRRVRPDSIISKQAEWEVVSITPTLEEFVMIFLYSAFEVDCKSWHIDEMVVMGDAPAAEPTVSWLSSGQLLQEDGATAVGVVAQLNQPSDQTLTVPFALDGTATSDDHDLVAGSLAFPAGTTSASLSFNIIDDSLLEPDEVLILILQDGDGFAVGEPSQHNITILASDRRQIRWGQTSYDVTEGESLVLEASLDVAADSELSVPFTLSGSADGSDHNLVAGSIVFPAGSQSTTLSVTITDDGIRESTENLQITLEETGSVIANGQHVATISIRDNDQPVFSWSVATREQTEGTLVTIDASVSTTPLQTLTVPIEFGGTAQAGLDYTADRDSFTFGPGATTATLGLTLIDDDLKELDETIVLGITAERGLLVGTPGEAVVTVLDGDPVAISWATSAGSITEASDTHYLAIAQVNGPSSSPVSVDITTAGTAIAGTDYVLSAQSLNFAAGETVQALDITIVDDALARPDRTLELGFSGVLQGEHPIHALQIIDDDQVYINWEALLQTADEGGGTLSAVCQLSQALDQDVTICVETAGEAEIGSDYELADACIVIPAGSTDGSFSVTLIDDDIKDRGETIVLALQAATGVLVGERAEHTISIKDNDRAFVSFLIGGQTVTETPVTTARVSSVAAEVVLSQPEEEEVVVTYRVAGTANNEDHDLAAGTLTFAPGETRLPINFELFDDPMQEADELLLISLNGTDDTPLGEPGEHRVLITDDDPNQAPETTILAPADGDVFSLDARISAIAQGTDPQGDPIEFRWEICSTTGDCETRTGTALSGLTFSQPGDYIFSCLAVDSIGNEDPTLATARITVVENQPPTATIITPDQDKVYVEQGDTVNFGATAEDPDSEQQAAGLWYFLSDPDTHYEGYVFAWQFDELGLDTLVFQATDDQGATGTDHITIEVTPVGQSNPSVRIDAPGERSTYDLGETITFTASTSEFEGLGDPIYTWDLGDGRSMTGLQLTDVSYERSGHYFITFQALAGGTVYEAGTQIYIVDSSTPPAVANNLPSETRIQPGGGLYLEARAIDNKGYQELNYSWDLGDGRIINKASPGLINYPESGTYVVSLYATTPAGKQSSINTTTVAVEVTDEQTFEPNGSFFVAPNIPPGCFASQRVTNDDLDFYQFDVPDGCRGISLLVTTSAAATVAIYNGQQQLITSKAVDGKDYINLPRRESGAYYLSVSATSEEPIDYEFDLSITEPVLYFPEVRNDERYATELGIVNPNEEEASMTLYGYDAGGSLLTSLQLRLAANGRLHLDSQSLFGEQTGRVAWARVVSDFCLIGYANTASHDGKELYATNATDVRHTELYVPHIAERTDQWFTRSSVVNAGNTAVSGLIETPMTTADLAIDAPFSQDAFDYLERMGGDPEGNVWARLMEQNQAPYLGGTEVFGSVSGPRLTAGVTLCGPRQQDLTRSFTGGDLYMPINADTDTFWTGFVLTNMSNSAQAARVLLYGPAGELPGEVTIAFDPGEKQIHLARDFVAEIAPGAEVAWLKIETGTEIAGLELFGTHDATRMAGLATESAPREQLMFPFIDATGRYDHQITLINVNGDATEASFRLYANDGTLITETSRELTGGGKLVQDLAELFPTIDFQTASPGWLGCSATLPVTGFELFVNRNGEQMAGIGAW